MPSLLGAATRLLLVLALSAAGETVHHYQASQSAALLAWKRSLGDPVALSTWTETSRACDAWRGVTCDAAGHVTSIRLGNVGLNGGLALDLAAFPALAAVDLHGNNLGGAIPPEFVRGRSGISYLDLSGNAFTGPIPDALPKSLKHLNLTGNAFTGPIPVSLARMALQDLHIGFNNISGGVPEFLGSMLQLKSLVLGWNPLGPWGVAPLCSRQALHAAAP